MKRSSSVVCAGAFGAAFAGILCAAQTPTQPASPGQAGTAGTSTQTPANATQPGTAPTAQQLPNGATPAAGKLQGPATGVLLGKAGPPPVLVPGQAVSLEQALALAQTNEPIFAAASAAVRVAKLDRSIAKAALLPSVIYHNQFLYTQSNHIPGSQIFIANNGVHEYVSQGQVTESLGFAQYNAIGRADAATAIATAELEIARRGLSATVIGLFYALTTSAGKITIQQRAVQEAQDFVKQTTQREAEREVAHADVLKANLTLQQRQRDLADAQLQQERSRLDLGVLLYPDPRTPFTVTLPAPAPLPDRATVEAAASKNNPEVAGALASVRSSSLGVTVARAGYLPSLVLNYSYGIDAPTFAINAPDRTRQIGYSASATLDIPVFDWFATQHRVKQAEILRDASRVTLTAAQRMLIANTQSFYNEIRVAHDQLESLQTTVDTARESLRLTRLRYGNGEGTVLEVVDAQNTLTLSETAYQDGVVRYQLALANLQILTGNF